MKNGAPPPLDATPASGLLDRLVAHETGAANAGSPSGLRAWRPYPFESMAGLAAEGGESTMPDAMPSVHGHRSTMPSAISLPPAVAPRIEETAWAPPAVPPRSPDVPATARQAHRHTGETTTTTVIEQLVHRYVSGVEAHRASAPPVTGVPATQAARAAAPSALPVAAVQAPIPSVKPERDAPSARRVPPIPARAHDAPSPSPMLRPVAAAALAPLPPRHRQEPVIEIHIGRLDVRAQPSSMAAARTPSPAPARDDRLSQYLGRRTRGARS